MGGFWKSEEYNMSKYDEKINIFQDSNCLFQIRDVIFCSSVVTCLNLETTKFEWLPTK